MDVRKEDLPVDPAYPDAREFLKNRAAISAAILGAGMALGGCADTGRTGGVSTRTGGVVAVPDGSKEAWAGDPKTWRGSNEKETDKPVRLGGEIPAEPKTEPPRSMGKFRIEPEPEPPALPGSPPVVPSKTEH